jgi:hypothetical protein
MNRAIPTPLVETDDKADVPANIRTTPSGDITRMSKLSVA